jgi:phage FluMu protein Com
MEVRTERVCEKCGEANELTNETVKRKDVHTEDGEQIRLIYYKCKRCKELNVVQIDDAATIKDYRELKDLIVKAARKRLKNETVSPKWIKKKDKLNKRINKRREDLKEIHNCKKILDENGKVFVECLTFRKASDIIESKM